MALGDRQVSYRPGKTWLGKISEARKEFNVMAWNRVRVHPIRARHVRDICVGHGQRKGQEPSVPTIGRPREKACNTPRGHAPPFTGSGSVDSLPFPLYRRRREPLPLRRNGLSASDELLHVRPQLFTGTVLPVRHRGLRKFRKLALESTST